MKRSRIWISCLLLGALALANSMANAQGLGKPPRDDKRPKHQDDARRRGGGEGGNFTVPPELAAQRQLNVVLGRPTDRSITLSVLSATDIEARVEYGTRSGVYTEKTRSQTSKARVPLEFELGPLKADTRYYYHVATRSSTARDFRTEPEGTFHTQRARGSTFTFALQGDSHPEREGKMFDPGLYAQTMRHVAKDAPDFYLTMGDDFSLDRLIAQKSYTQSAVDQIYAHQRTFLGLVGRSAALFLINGNHEHGDRYLLDGTENSPAVMAGRARTQFYPLPAPDDFYTGDREEVKFAGPPRDYYAWTWGDALFVVIDFYWHSPVPVDHVVGAEHDKKGEKREGGKKDKKDGDQKRDPWGATLGNAQYQWLTKTLTESKSRWKFVFCHHVMGTGRGGIEGAEFSEWGGKDRRGGSAFAEKRPGWKLPIHDLMAKTGVTIFFQGHDHIFARQELDGVVYQSCPNPADQTYQAFNRDAYQSGDILPNSGHLRMTVSPQKVGVDYVRSFLAKDATAEHRDGEVAFHYEIPASTKPVKPDRTRTTKGRP